jgi:hypothetical protein
LQIPLLYYGIYAEQPTVSEKPPNVEVTELIPTSLSCTDSEDLEKTGKNPMVSLQDSATTGSENERDVLCQVCLQKVASVTLDVSTFLTKVILNFIQSSH